MNDAFRTTLKGGKVVATQGILARQDFVEIIEMVRTFEQFNSDNDPYCECAFGAFEIDGQQVFWQISYYDSDLRYGSPDPADPTVTQRVLTIMLAEEY